jgi:hypothetical protein
MSRSASLYNASKGCGPAGRSPNQGSDVFQQPGIDLEGQLTECEAAPVAIDSYSCRHVEMSDAHLADFYVRSGRSPSSTGNSLTWAS